MTRLFVCFLFVFFSAKACGQEDSLQLHRPTESYFRLQYDNDFFSATDRYYTQGTLLTLVHPSLKRSPAFALLPKLDGSVQYYQFTLRQDVFTPRSIRYMGGAVYEGERPYTALLYLTHQRSSLKSQSSLSLKSNIDIGVLGPAARGEETQKGIHKALDNIEPLGWQNQLSASPLLNYGLLVEKGIFLFRYFEMLGHARGRLGTLYTDAGAGITIRGGLMDPYFTNLGLSKDNKRFRLYFLFRSGLSLPGYNATLQGGLFSSNIYALPARSLKRVVADASATVVLAFKRFLFEYGRYYLTPEFEGGLDHGWGRAGIWYCF